MPDPNSIPAMPHSIPAMPPVARSLHRKLAQVMYEAERIPKRGKAPAAMGGFEFVQVGDAADFIRKALAEKVITMMPTHVQIVGQAEHTTKAGGSMTTVDLITDWTLTDGESGESIVIQSFGAGADAGDKYSGKAQTNAMKYALLMGFLLSTGDDPELSDSSDRRPPRPSGSPPTRPAADPDGLTGTVELGKGDADMNLRQQPDDTFHLGFRLVSPNGGIKVMAVSPLAEQIEAHKAKIVGARVTCWGRITDESYTPKPKPGAKEYTVTYQVLTLERIRVPDVGDLPRVFSADDEAKLDGLLA